jgi:hypothetical protein
MRSSLPTLEDPAIQEAIAPPGRRRAGRTAEQLDPDSVLDLQQTAGNHAVNTLVQERDGDFKTKTEAIKGGLSGLELDISFNVSGKKAAGIQAVQAWWGSGSTLGQGVGKTGIEINKKKYEAFIDGGQFSPWVTLSGEKPAHPTQPYYLTADEVKSQVTWDGEKGSIRVYDLPSASALFEEMFFETAIVAVDVDGKGTDEILQVFTWGSSKQGTKQLHDKGDKIDRKDSHIVSSSTPSATFKQILKNDYPGYKYI